MRPCLPRSALLLLLLFACPIIAHIESCAGACELALSHLVFPDVDASQGYYPNQCGSHLRIASVFVCMRSYCRPREIAVGWERFNADCEQYGNITLPPFSIVENVTDEEVGRFRRFGVDEFAVGLELDRPAFPERELFGVAYRTKDAWNDSVATRHAYGNAMFYFWAAVVLIGLGTRVYEHKRLQSEPPLEEGALSTRLTRPLQRHLTIPATFSHHCAEPIGWCTIPPRLHTCTLILFATINTVLCCINYDVFTGNLYWATPVQWSRYIGDRTGILATANLPILWLLATRNNILLYITGWSFETSMHFHRWVARISTIQAVVHSVAYTMVSLQLGSWPHYWANWTQRYWTAGVLATIVMCLLCAFSVYPIRQHRYELFLLLHISLGVLTLLGMWYHVEIFNGDYDWYLWPCLAIWALDRVTRLCRLAYLNFPLLRTSTAAWDSKSNMVTLSVPCAVAKQPRPGEYFFLYLLHDRTFYESHPFTLSSWSSAGPTRSCSQSQSQNQILNFLIRPYDGFTGRLADLAGETGAAKVRVLLEGPYGPAHDLTHHDELVFVVGGTGIAVALAYLTDMCTRVESHTKKQAYRARYVRIVWAVQQFAMFEQVYEQEIQPRMAAAGGGGDEGAGFLVELDVYVTRSTTSTEGDLSGRISPTRTRDATGDKDQEEQEQDREDQSEHSPLLSPSASPSASPPRVASPSPPSPQPARSSSSIQPSAKNHPCPKTTLTLHHHTRPDIPALLLATCRHSPATRSSMWSPATPAQTESATESLLQARDSESVPEENEKTKTTRRRIAIVSCGPGSLADATRAGVVQALGRAGGEEGGEGGVEVRFYNESYSW